MERIKFLGLLFIIKNLAGLYAAYFYGRRTKKFKWNEYVAIIIVPIIAIVLFTIFVDSRIINLFIISCIAGFAFEYIFGLAYHKTLNKRLWEYKYLSVGGYTSLLSIPVWGIGGVTFWFLSKIVGL